MHSSIYYGFTRPFTRRKRKTGGVIISRGHVTDLKIWWTLRSVMRGVKQIPDLRRNLKRVN